MATDTKDIGALFFHVIDVVKGTPLVHRAPTQEIDHPYRRSRSWIIRLWPSRKAVVVGWWMESGLSEEDALFAAISMKGRMEWDVKTDDEGNLMVRDRARTTVATHAKDLDDEWLLLNALDLVP